MAEKKIQAKELVAILIATKPKAEVENDEDCYLKPRAEIEVDEDGLCSLAVHPEMPSSPDMGNFRIKINGVVITVSRGIEGPDDDWEFAGPEIVYDGDVTVSDVIAAVMNNVTFPSYSDFVAAYNDTEFDSDDVADSVEEGCDEVYAMDAEDNVYRYDTEDDIPEDQDAVDFDDALSRLIEQWEEDGGGADDMMVESLGPWS